MSFFGKKDSEVTEKPKQNAGQQSVPDALKGSEQMKNDVEKVMKDLMNAKAKPQEKQAQAVQEKLPDPKNQENDKGNSR